MLTFGKQKGVILMRRIIETAVSFCSQISLMITVSTELKSSPAHPAEVQQALLAGISF